MRYLISLVIVVFWMAPCSSQGTRGGEMRFFIHYMEIDARFMIYREGESKDSLVVDWGDSTIETLDWIESVVYPSVIIDVYNKKHTYSEPGSYAISFVDGPLISGVSNIENSNEKYLHLVDTVVVYAPPHEYSFNEGIILDNNQLIFDVDDGVIKLPAIIGWGNGFPDYTEMVKVPYPVPGFTYPEAINGIYTNNQESPFYSELVWDRPVEPGIYALAFKLRELVPNIDTPDPNDTIMLSTYTRAMMVDVDSSNIVLTSIPEFPDVELDVFPNPATDYLYIQATGFENNPDYQLLLSDLQGRVLREKQGVILNGRLENQMIDVSDLPSGIYQVLLRFDGYEFMKRVVVE